MTKIKTKQQTVFLPEDMIDWIHEEERRSGATLSRIVAAAVCGYSLLGLLGKQHSMDLAMRIEQGETTFENIPVFCWERIVLILKGAVKRADGEEEKKKAKENLRIAEELLESARAGRRRSAPAADLPTYLTNGTDYGGNFDPHEQRPGPGVPPTRP